MRLQTAAICLLAAISTFGSKASAHIDFNGDFECVDSYEKGCILVGASLDRRNMRMFFDGTTAENGKRCEIRTAKLQQELTVAAQQAGVAASDIEISSIIYGQTGARGVADQFRCSYVISSKRKDLRFSAHHFSRRFWTDREERAGVCMDDVRKAQAIPGSIGAAKWITAALAQGYICNTNYALMGLDRVGRDLNGKVRVIKFGERQYDVGGN